MMKKQARSEAIFWGDDTYNREIPAVIISTDRLGGLNLKLVHTSLTGIKRASPINLQENRE
jgi:hypothetical protein